MRWIRRLHSWLGVLFAPSILLFVVSGMFQIAGCHDAHPGEEPPHWIVRLAQLHMKQTIELPRRRAPAPAAARPAAPAPAATPSPPPSQPTTLPLKVFFFAMAIGLLVSTLFGLYMAFTPRRDRKLLAALLVIGVALPVLLMAL